jgi:hypothetical protein
MHSSFLLSVDIKEFHTAETYSHLVPVIVLYNISKEPGPENEKIKIGINPSMLIHYKKI